MTQLTPGNPWFQAVADACHSYQIPYYPSDPEGTLRELLETARRDAQDPRVSEQAAAAEPTFEEIADRIFALDKTFRPPDWDDRSPEDKKEAAMGAIVSLVTYLQNHMSMSVEDILDAVGDEMEAPQ